MLKFGQPPRALESFGVVGLLADGCKVYYDSVFSARHIGRVSDLMTAQLRSAGLLPDELRFRVVLMFSLYEAYRCQLLALGDGEADGEILAEPLVIECGVDAEKLAVGVSFSHPPDQAVDPDALLRNVASGKASNRIESFIAQMSADCDQVVVRIEAQTRKVEVVSLLALSGGARERGSVEVVALRPDVRISPLKAEYIELADLDYAKLLSEDGPASLEEKPATGEFLAESASTEEASTLRISGQSPEQEKITRIAGVTRHLDGDDTEILISGSDASESGGAGGASDPQKELQSLRRQAELYRQQVAQLQGKLGLLEQQRQSEMIVVSSRAGSTLSPAASSAPSPTGPDPQAQERGSSFKEIIQNLWPFNRGQKPQESPMPSLLQPQESSEQGPAAVGDLGVEIDAIDPETGRLLKEQVENLEKTIERIQQESDTLKKEVGNGRAKKWMDGMVADLFAEKARINEMAKKLNVSFRQKELEFKNRETTLQEELRRKDEQIRQKTYALERSKEQLSQATASVERGRNGQSMASEETQYRQKLLFTQKLLAATKEENANLARRFEDVRTQLTVAQNMSKVKLQKDIEFDSMRSKHDRLVKQVDEFKRANHQLMEKLNEMEKQKSGGSPDEVKRKFDAAVRMAATHQKDSELLRMKVEELQKSEARLKGELNRLTNSLRSRKNSGGGTGGSQAA